MSSSSTETVVEVTMPKMGISVSEGTIVEWRKRPGDWVEADETIAEVTTDKIDVEIPSPASGRLAKLIAEPGETVDVGETIAEIDAGARPGEAHPQEDDDVPSAPERESDAATDEVDRSGFVSPVVRRIADKHGVDPTQIEGTGIGGRVRKKDVLAYVEAHAGNGQGKPQPVLHSESPYRPDEPPSPSRPCSRLPRAASAARRCRRCARRSPGTWSRAARPRRIAPRSSRSTCRGSPPAGRS